MSLNGQRQLSIGTPRWLVAAAAVIFCYSSVLVVLDPSALTLIATAVAVTFAYFLLRGSRIAWVVVLVGAVDQLIRSTIGSEGYGNLAEGGILIVCLFAPASVRFVWTQRPYRRAGRIQLALKRPYEKVKTSAYGALARVAGWETGRTEGNAVQQRSYGLLLWRLGVSWVLLLLLVGGTYDLQQGVGGDNPIANVIASVTWTCFAFVQLAFIAALLIAAYQRFVAPRVSSQALRSKSN